MRFMFEKHPEEIDSFIGYLRVGDYDGYANYINESIGVKYDNEWTNWLGEFVQPNSILRRRCCTALAESEIRLWWWPRYVRA